MDSDCARTMVRDWQSVDGVSKDWGMRWIHHRLIGGPGRWRGCSRAARRCAHWWLPDWWRSLWAYHQQMLQSTESITSPHPYQSSPWSWLVQGRPTSFFYEGPKKGADGCLVDQCSKAITSIGTLSIWWGGTIAVFVLLFLWALRRDWRAGAVLGGLAAGYLPWFLLSNRTIYSFYAVAFVPWVVLACVHVLGLLIGVFAPVSP